MNKSIVAGVMAVALLIPQVGLAWGDYSDGSRVGNLYKYSYKGIFWKNYSGEMNLGGVASDANGNTIANTWDFSLDKDHKHGENVSQLNATLNKALDDGKRVRVYYHQEIIVAPWRASSDYLVYKVQEIN